MAPNSWRHKGHEASFVLRTHNSSLTSKPPFYLTLFARCTCTDTHFVCKKNASIIREKNWRNLKKTVAQASGKCAHLPLSNYIIR